MIGRKILEMKMQSNTRPHHMTLDDEHCKEKVNKIKSKDIVSMSTIWENEEARYLVIQVSRSQSFIDVLPLEQFFSDKDKVEAPVLSVPFYMIENLKKMDKSNLLFLANRPNPHIMKALDGM
ncbi:hypothetical protein CMI41_04715 [Candidatus Pacearchaeota archaeon]|nr:hypothetical protein [Candidatus Pacearchaeota archaeon]